MRLANALPASKTPLVAIHCDAILAAVDPGGSIPVSGSVAEEIGGELNTSNKNSSPLPTAANSNVRAPAGTTTNRDVASSPLQKADELAPPARPPNSNSSFEDDPLNSVHNSPPTGEAENHNDDPTDRDVSAHEMPPPMRFDESAWSRPILRILPTKENVASSDKVSPNHNANETASAKPPSVGPNGRAALPSDVGPKDGLSEVDSKELLRRWRAADGDEASLIERELSRRGFGKITPELVQRFFSDEAQNRMRLVNDALAIPGGGAGAWLMLLADDRDAEVRLFAVTLMSTSNDASLVDKAWQVSLHDHDPRIADLASRLRERRAGTLRR